MSSKKGKKKGRSVREAGASDGVVQGSKGIEGESLAGLSLGASCDLTHNAQHLRSRCLPPKCPWENLPIKKLNAFLADVNTKGQLSLTKKEVLAEIDHVVCGTCKRQLQEGLSKWFDARSGSIIPSIKMTRLSPESGATGGEVRMSVAGCMSPAHLNQLKDFLKAAEKEEGEGPAVGWEEGGGKLAGDAQELTFEDGRHQQKETGQHRLELLTKAYKMSGASRVVATLESLKEHQKRMLELGLAIKNLLDSPGNIGRSPHVSTLLEGWNEPKHLQPHLNNLEATLKAGLNEMTVFLQKVLGVESASAAIPLEERMVFQEAAHAFFNYYERTIEQILELSITGRREQSKETQPQHSNHLFQLLNPPPTPKTREIQARSCMKKKEVAYILFETVLQLFAEGKPARAVFDKHYGLCEILDVLPVGDYYHLMERLEVNTLQKRVDVCIDPSTRPSLMAQELTTEADFKQHLDQWEKHLQKAWDDMGKTCKAQLAVAEYPQTLKMADDLRKKEKSFEDGWEALLTAHSYQAKISQEKINSLSEKQQVYKLKLKNAKDNDEKRGEGGKGRSSKRGGGTERDIQSLTNLISGGESGTIDEGDEERSKLTIQIQDTTQRQIEECLVFRVFAAKNCVERQQIIRRYRTLIQMSERRKKAITDVLCGDESKATEKLSIIFGALVMEKLTRECLTWQAQMFEKELLEEEVREDEKRKKKKVVKQNQSQPQANRDRKTSPVQMLPASVVALPQHTQSIQVEKEATTAYPPSAAPEEQDPMKETELDNNKEQTTHTGMGDVVVGGDDVVVAAVEDDDNGWTMVPTKVDEKRQRPKKEKKQQQQQQQQQCMQASARPQHQQPSGGPSPSTPTKEAPIIQSSLKPKSLGQNREEMPLSQAVAPEVQPMLASDAIVASPSKMQSKAEDISIEDVVGEAESLRQEGEWDGGLYEKEEEPDQGGPAESDEMTQSVENLTSGMVDDDRRKYAEASIVSTEGSDGQDGKEEEDIIEPTFGESAYSTDEVIVHEPEEGEEEVEGNLSGDDSDIEICFGEFGAAPRTPERKAGDTMMPMRFGWDQKKAQEEELVAKPHHTPHLKVPVPRQRQVVTPTEESGKTTAQGPSDGPYVRVTPPPAEGGGGGGGPGTAAGGGPMMPIFIPHQGAPFVYDPIAGGPPYEHLTPMVPPMPGPDGLIPFHPQVFYGHHPQHHPHLYPMMHHLQNGYMEMPMSGPMYGGHMYNQQMGPPRRSQYSRGGPMRRGGYSNNNYTYSRGSAPYQPPYAQLHAVEGAGGGSGAQGMQADQNGDNSMSPAGRSPQQEPAYASHPPPAHLQSSPIPPPPHPSHHYNHGVGHAAPYSGPPKKLQSGGAQSIHPTQHLQDEGGGAGGGSRHDQHFPPRNHNKGLSPQHQPHQLAPSEGMDTGGWGVHPVTQDMGKEAVDSDASCEGGSGSLMPHRVAAHERQEMGRVGEEQVIPAQRIVEVTVNHGHTNGRGVPVAATNGRGSGVPSLVGKSSKKASKQRGTAVVGDAARGPLSAAAQGGQSRMGQNNCYLNVVAQSLWRLTAFRDQICARVYPEVDTEEGHRSGKLEQTLRALMKEFGESKMDHSKGEGGKVSIDTLRQVLSELEGQKAKFCAGNMDDAVEAFEEILTLLVEGGGEGKKAVENAFCLYIREMILCPSCHQPSPVPANDYDTNVFYVPVRSLMDVASRQSKHHEDFGGLLQGAGSGDLYSCAQKGCNVAKKGHKMAGHRYLLKGAPKVFCLGLVWDNLKADSREIESILDLIDPVLSLRHFQLGPVQAGASSKAATEGGIGILRGFFAFHPQKHHYVAFFHRDEDMADGDDNGRGGWICIDDEQIRSLGSSHLEALAKCAELSYQPSLLFYEVTTEGEDYGKTANGVTHQNGSTPSQAGHKGKRRG